MPEGDAVLGAWLSVLDRLERALDNPERSGSGQEGLMKRWGALLVETSQRSFQEQKFGEYEWWQRYPGMEPPFINIAGALTDFDSGRNAPKPNRFQDRPALIDEGMRGGLWGSITFNVSGPHEVEVGTNKPYAKVHQDGGQTVIRISRDAKRRIQDWLFTKKAPFAPRKGKEGYVDKLWPAAVKAQSGGFRQRIIRRPFLGVPEQTAKDLIRATEEYFGMELGGAGGPAK